MTDAELKALRAGLRAAFYALAVLLCVAWFVSQTLGG